MVKLTKLSFRAGVLVGPKEKSVEAVVVAPPEIVASSKQDAMLSEGLEKSIERHAPKKANAFVKGMSVYVQNEAFTPVQYYRIS